MFNQSIDTRLQKKQQLCAALSPALRELTRRAAKAFTLERTPSFSRGAAHTPQCGVAGRMGANLNLAVWNPKQSSNRKTGKAIPVFTGTCFCELYLAKTVPLHGFKLVRARAHGE